jgi:hypothetical protein
LSKNFLKSAEGDDFDHVAARAVYCFGSSSRVPPWSSGTNLIFPQQAGDADRRR